MEAVEMKKKLKQIVKIDLGKALDTTLLITGGWLIASNITELIKQYVLGKYLLILIGLLMVLYAERDLTQQAK